MSEQEERAMRLSEVLVKRGLVSEAQLELAMADREINDLPLEEVLIARGWIREDALYEAAPWLKVKLKPGAGSDKAKSQKPSGASAAKGSSSSVPPEKPSAAEQKPADKPAASKVADLKAPPTGPGKGMESESPLPDNYDENVKAYREMLKKITGEDFEDNTP